jgi:hypothetical protein
LSVNGREFGWSSWPVAADQTEVVVVLKRAEKPPVARLKCRILLPDGRPTSGEVMVHETPDLVYGSRVSTESKHGNLAIVEREPKGKVCVSAWVHRHPIAVVGPIDLTVGDHDVVLQLERPQTIRGLVVDSDGSPAAVRVHLRRPAGVFERLAEGVPPILRSTASGDSIVTLEDGAFSFENLGAGEHELFVSDEGFSWPAKLRVQPGQYGIVVRLGDGIDDLAKVEGRMTRAGSDEGVPGRVWLRSVEYSSHAFVADDGRFRITAPPGKYTLEAVSLRCAFVRQQPRDLAAAFSRWDLVVTPCEPLFVRVVDTKGVAVEGVTVRALDAAGKSMTFVDAMGNTDGDEQDTSSSGRAGLGGLPDVAVKLVFNKDGHRQELLVAAGTPRMAELEIVWKPGS